jgi:glycosyltransferase involved in cell wall biosynthesis
MDWNNQDTSNIPFIDLNQRSMKYFETKPGKKKMTYSVVIPAKNESKHITNVIKSVINQTISPEFVCIINDGSSDNTQELINNVFIENWQYWLKSYFIVLPERKLSLLGSLSLGKIFNLGFKKCEKLNTDFVMIVGGDTFLPQKYVEILLKEFKKNPNLVITSGITPDNPINNLHVEGSGRIIRSSFFKKIGYKYPEVTAWETSPLYIARSLGYEAYHTKKAKFYGYRTATSNMKNLCYWGSGMRSVGYWTPYAIGRIVSYFIHTKNLKRTIQMISGYLSFKTVHNSKEVKSFVKKFQIHQVKKIVLGK